MPTGNRAKSSKEKSGYGGIVVSTLGLLVTYFSVFTDVMLKADSDPNCCDFL